MNGRSLSRKILGCWRLALAGLCLWPGSLLACATCFGASSDPMARGMTMGILALLAVVMFVLSGIAAFGIFLARRAARFSQTAPASLQSEATSQSEAAPVESLLSEPTK